MVGSGLGAERDVMPPTMNVNADAKSMADSNESKENFIPPTANVPLEPIATPTILTNSSSGPAWWQALTPTLRALIVAGVLVAFGWLFAALAPVLTPFMFGAILSYVGTPAVAWLASHRVPRTIGAVLVIVACVAMLMGFVLIIAPMISTEISQIAAKSPELVTKAQTVWLPWINQQLGTEISFDLTQLRVLAQDNAGALGNISAQLAGSMKLGGQVVLGLLVNVILVPVVMFYLLRDWPTLIDGIDRLVPRAARLTVRQLASEIDAVLSEFLRGQGLVMVALAAYYAVALKLVGLQFWLPVGLVTGLLVFVPYIGFGMGLVLGMLAALTQFSTPGPIIAVAAVFGAGQIIEGFVLTPKFVGERIGLHPLAVIFALMAFGQLFGFVGVLLALPASAALLVAFRFARRNVVAEETATPVTAPETPRPVV